MIYGQRVPSDGHVTFSVCNFSGTTQAPITICRCGSSPSAEGWSRGGRSVARGDRSHRRCSGVGWTLPPVEGGSADHRRGNARATPCAAHVRQRVLVLALMIAIGTGRRLRGQHGLLDRHRRRRGESRRSRQQLGRSTKIGTAQVLNQDLGDNAVDSAEGRRRDRPPAERPGERVGGLRRIENDGVMRARSPTTRSRRRAHQRVNRIGRPGHERDRRRRRSSPTTWSRARRYANNSLTDRRRRRQRHQRRDQPRRGSVANGRCKSVRHHAEVGRSRTRCL